MLVYDARVLMLEYDARVLMLEYDAKQTVCSVGPNFCQIYYPVLLWFGFKVLLTVLFVIF